MPSARRSFELPPALSRFSPPAGEGCRLVGRGEVWVGGWEARPGRAGLGRVGLGRPPLPGCRRRLASAPPVSSCATSPQVAEAASWCRGGAALRRGSGTRLLRSWRNRSPGSPVPQVAKLGGVKALRQNVEALGAGLCGGVTLPRKAPSPVRKMTARSHRFS